MVVQWLVRTLRFHCRGPSSVPGQETKIPQAAQWGQEKKERKKENERMCEGGKKTANASIFANFCSGC